LEVFNQLKGMKMMNTEEFENAMNEGRIERYHCLWVLAEVKRLRQAFLIATGHIGYGNHLGHTELRHALNSAGIDADSLSWAHGEWGEEE